ncbi:hypothetical protein ISCGN_016118 [Ixodes scapularis]
MVILRRIRTGGATTPYMTQKFETIMKRKLSPDYEPPDQRCQLCKGDGTHPKRYHLIWECEALATHKSDAWAQLGRDTPSSYEEWIRPFGDSERRVRILRTLLNYTMPGDLRQDI